MDLAATEPPLAAAGQELQPRQPSGSMERVTLRTSSRLRLRRNAASALLPVGSSAALEAALVLTNGRKHAAAEAVPADGEGSTLNECLVRMDAGAADRQAPGLEPAHVSHVALEHEDESHLDIQDDPADACQAGAAQSAATGTNISDSSGAIADPRDGSAAAPAGQQEDAAATARGAADDDMLAESRWAARPLHPP